MAPRFALPICLAVLFSGLLSRPASADNWQQYLRDERRTAASPDPVKLPLTDIWSWPGAQPSTLWRGRAYFVTSDRSQDILICADSRTGRPLWRQAFGSVHLRSPMVKLYPVVSDSGVVYVIGAAPGRPSPVAAFGSASSGSAPVSITIPGGNTGVTSFVAAYRAVDGAPIARYPGPADRPEPTAWVIAQDARTVTVPEPRLGLPYLFFGYPLLTGDQYFISNEVQLFRWTPGGHASAFQLAHELVDATEPRQCVGSTYAGAYPVAAQGGLVVGGSWDDKQFPVGQSVSPVRGQNFLALVGSDGVRWHRDLLWRPAGSAVEGDLVITRLSSNGGRQAVTCMDVATGAPRWFFPPKATPQADGTIQVSGIEQKVAPGRAPVVRTRGGTVVDWRGMQNMTSAPLVVADGRVFLPLEFTLTALDARTGAVVWQRPSEGAVLSLVASKDHLFARLTRSDPHRKNSERVIVAAFRKSDGNLDWTQEVPGFADLVPSLSLADGLLYYSGGATLSAFAPAERTYQLAVDSELKEHYRKPDPDAEKQAAPPAPTLPTPAIAEATVLRLWWNEPLEELQKKLRARREIAPEVPMLVALQWLNPQGDAAVGARGGKRLLPEADTFLGACRAVASLHPEHLDLSPDVNVFLTRNPEQQDALRALLELAVKEVRQASPETKVLVSFNAEVLAGVYGRGKVLPYGKITLPARPALAEARTLAAIVDEIGFNSVPQSAFDSPAAVPSTYFLDLKAVFGPKPVLISRMWVRRSPPEPGAKTDTSRTETEHASYVKHLLQACYWLDARLVAYPDASVPAGSPSADSAFRVGDQWRLAMDVWKDALSWKRVERLTLAPPEPMPAPNAANP